MSIALASQPRAPFSYFGCKTAVAPEVWERLGNPRVFVEPFAGSLGVLLARPGGAPPASHLEIVNDADGHISNVWRAIRSHPAELVDAMTEGVREVDLHARAAVAAERRAELVDRLAGDPGYVDVELAQWWISGMLHSIPGDWLAPGPWHREMGEDGAWRLAKGAPGTGLKRSRPGDNVNFAGLAAEPETWLHLLAERLQRVTILCGDWTRAVSPYTLNQGNRPGTRAVFLDPPYATRHHAGIYGVDEPGVADDVRGWCLAADPAWRIALAGYDDEHSELEQHGWTVLAWRASGGVSKDRRADRERLWFSPSCVDPVRQPTLF